MYFIHIYLRDTMWMWNARYVSCYSQEIRRLIFKSGSFSWGAARNFQIFVSLSSKYILYSRPPVTCNVFEEIFLCTINCKNSRSNADLVYKKKVVKNSNRLKCGFILYFPSCIWLKRSIHWSFFPYPYVRYIFTE